MESFFKSIQSMMEFLKATFLVLRFSCYKLKTLLTYLMISAVLLSMLVMVIPSTLSMIRQLGCGNT